MKFVRAAPLLLGLLVALPGWAAGSWSVVPNTSGTCSTFTWTSSDAGNAQPALQIPPGEVSITSEVASGTPSVVLYLVPTPGNDNPASGGTTLATVTATSRAPTFVRVNAGYVVDPDVDTASNGGSLTVCKAVYAQVNAGSGSGGSGGGHIIEEEGGALTQRGTLNFTGIGTCSDVGGKTVCDFPAGAATILDQAVGETDLRYLPTPELYYADIDGDNAQDNGEQTWPTDAFYAKDYQTGSTTCGIQEAVDAAGEGSTTDDQGAIIVLPKGTCTMTTGVVIGSVTSLTQWQAGLQLRGYGAGTISSGSDKLAGTTLVWGGAAGGAMFTVQGTNHSFSDFMIAGGGASGLAYGIRLVGDNTTNMVSSKNSIHRVSIFDVQHSSAGWGISIEGNGANDAQNDFVDINQVIVANSLHCLQNIAANALHNVARHFECAGFLGSPGLLLSRGGLDFQNLFLNPFSTNANAIGYQVDGCSIGTNVKDVAVEWPGDNGTVFKFSDTGLGCGVGTAYVTSRLERVRFLMQTTATTEHTCVEHSLQSDLVLDSLEYTSDSAAAGRKCDLEFTNSSTNKNSITRINNKVGWNYGADLTPIAVTATESSTGSLVVQTLDHNGLTIDGNNEPWRDYDRWYDWTTGTLWDGTELSRVTNRCQGSQRVIQGLQSAAGVTPYRGWIGGSATVTTEDYKTLAGSPSMGVCIFISGAGASPDTNGYPSDTAAASSNLSLGSIGATLEWDLHATINNSAQSKWSEFIRIGNSERLGFTSATTSDISTYGTVDNLHMRGTISARTTTDRDQDGGIDPVIVGEFPMPGFFRTGAKSTTHVFWHEAGQNTRMDAGQLRRYIAQMPYDMDDFAYDYSWHGWINNYGETEAYWSGVGMYLFGNRDGAHTGGELAGNQFGIVVNDPSAPDVLKVWSSCTSTFCGDRAQLAGGASGGHTIEQMTIEGSRINEIAAVTASSFTFNENWFERNGTTGSGTAGTGGSSTVIDNLTGTTFSTDGDTVGAIIWNTTDDSWCRISSVTDANTATCGSALTPSGSFDNGDAIAFTVTKGDSQAFGVGTDSQGRVCTRNDQWAAAETCTYRGASPAIESNVWLNGGFLAGDGNWPGYDGLVLGPFAVNDSTNAMSRIFVNSDLASSDTDTSDTTFTVSRFVANSASKTRVHLNDVASTYSVSPPSGYSYTRSDSRLTPRSITATPTAPGEILWPDEVVIVDNGSALGDCDPAAPTGTANTLCKWNGSAFEVVGDGGGISGSTGTTDNRLLRADGTGGGTLQNSAITVDDNGVMTFPSTGSISIPGNATAGQKTCILEDTDLGTSDLCFDLAATNLSAQKILTPNASGLFNIADMLEGSSANLRTALSDESGTGAALFAGATYVDSMYIPAGSMDVDGTQCTKSAAAVINSGPMILAINCADNASGIVYFEAVMPDGWGASGALTVEAEAYTVDATISGGADDTIGWDVSCMARGDGETINSTWGTAQNLDVTFVTQYVEEHVTSASITPDDFEAGDTLYCRAVVDTTTTDATTTDMRLKGLKVEFTRAIGD